MKLLKLSATALIIAGANLLFSQSALACTQNDPHYHACVYHNIILPQQQQQQGYGNSGGYGNNTGSNYPSQPTTKTECQMLNNGYQSCIHYSLSTGAIVIKEMINPKISRPISQIFYQPNGQIVSERYFDAQGEKHGTHKDYHSTGQLSAVVTYEHGKKLSAEYIENDGTVAKITYQYTPYEIAHHRVYVNGKQHGLEHKQFYNERKQKWVTLYEVNWVNGKKHGTEKFYSLVNDKGKTKLDKKVEWNNGVQVR
ncbi:hypothetical protein L3D26_04210 [Moraxella sp. ZY21109]|uniref:toxin-antitoxin system YwqK family antitoxin n=1 Tax=Moraxella sp. ZY21109 TaxID=2911969 RepID=UPI003D7D4B4A